MSTLKANNIKENKNNTLRDYVSVVKANLLLIIAISISILVASTVYAFIAPNVYKSSVLLKITKPQGSILESPLAGLQELNGGNDRFIANEIETIDNSQIKEQVARQLIDTFNVSEDKEKFNLLLDKDYLEKKKPVLKSIDEIISSIDNSIEVTQKNNLDFIIISAESESPDESALIANTFAKTYKDFNLKESRKQVSNVKKFLEEQRVEKLKELNEVEDELKAYQLKSGVIELDKTAQSLIDKLSQFESDKNATKIDISIAKEKLAQYKEQLKKQDPTLSSYLENKTSEPYLKMLQEQIARLETQKDLALAGSNSSKTSDEIIQQFNSQISELKNKLKKSVNEYQSMILSSSPEEMKELTQKAFEEEVKYQSLIASNNQMSNVINSYEQRFNQLPAKSLELARLERRRQATEKLYSAIEEKYQEAQLNEQAIPSNVLIMNNARPPVVPAKPKRKLIIIMGLFLGIGMSLGYVYVRSYFDKTIKSPEDIESKNINVLAWIPKIKEFSNKSNESELVVAKHPDSIQSESFKTLRTRIQFSSDVKDLKTILITSSAPGEGKSVISANLATSFAQDHKKTVVVDCDLRKPRIHTIFGDEDSAGFLNYFFGKSSYESIIKKTEIRNLDYITGGSIPPNPSEIIGSPRMKAFILKLKNEYDIIIIDSPPIMAVSDAEILSRLSDGNLLVVSADSTEVDWLEESVELLNHEKSIFLGVLLNKFNYKSGYHSYYKYYGHYSKHDFSGKKLKIKGKNN